MVSLDNIKISTVFISELLSQQHLNKSFISIPRTISKLKKNFEYEVLYFGDKRYEENEGLVCLGSSKVFKYKVFRFIRVLFYVVFNKIDVLMLLHISNYSSILSFFQKKINKESKVYLKLDIDLNYFKYNPSKISGLFIDSLLSISDVISYESILVKDKLLSDFYIKKYFHKIVYIPNCSPEASFKMKHYEKNKKKNVIITVGRLGSYQKNTELLIDALEDIDLSNWEVWLVGSITSSLKNRINISKNNKIIYKGLVDDRDEILSFYKTSKVFILTSRYEGFATVLCEASLFGNFIISTDVNGARDITDDFRFGKMIKDKDSLRDVIKDIITSKINVEDDSIRNCNFVLEEFNWEKVLNTSGLMEAINNK